MLPSDVTSGCQVMPFFHKLGFQCPEAKGDADFLQDVTIRKGQGSFRTDRKKRHHYMTVGVGSCTPSLPTVACMSSLHSLAHLPRRWHHLPLSMSMAETPLLDMLQLQGQQSSCSC